MVATALAALVGRASAQTSSAADTTSRQLQSIRVKPENVRLNNYLHDLVGPHAIIGLVGGSLLDQVFQKDRSWDDGSHGLARQIASRAGQQAVQVSVYHGLAALMHRSTDYEPCDCRGFGAHVEHALLETFTDRRDDGSRALSIPRIAGAYAGNFATLAWEHDRSASDAVLGTTMSFGFTALFNIARELSGLGVK